MGVIRIQDLSEFKKTVKDLLPDTILYSVDTDLGNQPPLNLRLVFYRDRNTYVYIDIPDNSNLKETKIPLVMSRKGTASIDDKEILRFLSNEFKNVDFAAFFDI